MRRYFSGYVVVVCVMGSLIGGMGLSAAADHANAALLVETTQLVQRLDAANVRIVDVRSKEAYDAGHIPNAVHLGADDIIDAQSHISGELLPVPRLATMLGERGIGKDTEVMLYDAKGGFLAARVFWMLEYFGHRTVRVLNGGFPKWTREGRAVTTAVPTVARTHFPITLIPRRYASADWVRDRARDAEVVVIDVRPGKMYQAGHIPWAKNIPWKANLTKQSTLKDAETLLKHFASHGVTKDKNVVVHCQAGKAAAHSYFTLRLLGYPRVRSYDRSWAEWGNADELPKAIGAGSKG